MKVAKTPDEAYELSKAIFGLDIKGHVVKRVMVAQGARIDKEYYFSVLLDRANRSYLSLCSVEGGMEIEELAVERPVALARVEVDPLTGIDHDKARSTVYLAMTISPSMGPGMPPGSSDQPRNEPPSIFATS